MWMQSPRNTTATGTMKVLGGSSQLVSTWMPQEVSNWLVNGFFYSKNRGAHQEGCSWD